MGSNDDFDIKNTLMFEELGSGCELTANVHLKDLLTEEERNRVNIHTVNVPIFKISDATKEVQGLEDGSSDERTLTLQEMKLNGLLGMIRDGELDGKHIYFKDIWVLNFKDTSPMVKLTIID